MISWEDFQKIDLRLGEITDVQDFPEARNPSYRIEVYFGEQIGKKKSCAQLTNYDKQELLGKQVVCVLNFPPKQIANAVSEVLILGVPNEQEQTILLTSEQGATLGARVF